MAAATQSGDASGHQNGSVAPVDPQQSYNPTIQVTKRTDRSTSMMLLQHVLKPIGDKLIRPKKEYPAGSPRLEPHEKATRLCEVIERQVEGIWLYDLLANRPAESEPGEQRRKKRLYYFSGGGWQMPASSEHWAFLTEMARKIPDTVPTMVSYPLAPNSPAPEAMPQLLRLYRSLMASAVENNEEVILAGDSAGGNIILCLTLSALMEDEDSPCPIALMCICPSTDLRRHNPDIKTTEKKDPLLNVPFTNETAQKWRADLPPTDPLVSPLYADVSVLARRGVKVHGILGRYDILGPDAVLMREKCNQAHVSGEWLDWEKQMHCFPLTFGYKLKEGVEGVEWMIDVLRRS
ncbi:hypothetical protein NU195Hw_g4068t1 [Hortaea werneckii]